MKEIKIDYKSSCLITLHKDWRANKHQAARCYVLGRSASAGNRATTNLWDLLHGEFVDKKIALKIIIDELKTKGSLRLLVKGGSMSPTISANSKIKILNSKHVKIGSIVMYKTGDWFLIHRVTGENKRTGVITVEGDSRDSVVHKIKKSAIIGIVEEKIRHKLMKVVAGVLKQRKQGKQVKQVKKKQ